jgi:hypothetical protein
MPQSVLIARAGTPDAQHDNVWDYMLAAGWDPQLLRSDKRILAHIAWNNLIDSRPFPSFRGIPNGTTLSIPVPSELAAVRLQMDLARNDPSRDSRWVFQLVEADFAVTDGAAGGLT